MNIAKAYERNDSRRARNSTRLGMRGRLRALAMRRIGTYTVRITASSERSELDIFCTMVGDAAYVRRNQWPCVCHCLCLRLRIAV
jgi:hypothetical protein